MQSARERDKGEKKGSNASPAHVKEGQERACIQKRCVSIFGGRTATLHYSFGTAVYFDLT